MIENIPVARVYTSGAEADSAVWRDLKSLLEERRIPLIPLHRGSVVESLSSARIEVLHPPEDANAETDLNDRSLVLRVESGG